ncbi:MarR family winged helix-turn-helix transcriptional regulator [Mycobacterium sp. 94-17]|uniref:MarR family winged helix-turn-helix transcriptional regulator n=1 Tax=Mycobacterium sp. 94-17 TaxID=2986147 RepID=UPI002D1E8236|nr:MarR family winged helix-turn-helix transcriptional regulator [Mycobacterium sp. 94-17]MEB4210357.1 MarR family winged helix-turn-helix transcriptional regulator [Mycobacterium sp. 94-17]
MPQTTEPHSEFGYYVHRVAALLDKGGDAMFRRELGISLRQFLLLRLIEMGDEMASQQAIADRLGIAKSAVSRHVDIARRKGWVQVDVSAHSRRQNRLTLTTAGSHLLAKAKTLIDRSQAEGFAGIPSCDVDATLRVLKALHQRLTERP